MARGDREPHERWFARGTGLGLVGGLLLGFVLGDVIVGLMVGLIFGAGIGVLANPGTRRDRDGRGRDGRDDPPRRRRWPWGGDAGDIDRGVLWLLVGLAVAAVLVVAISPELLAAPGVLGELLAVVLIAAVPGAAIVAVLAYRRRHDRDDEEA